MNWSPHTSGDQIRIWHFKEYRLKDQTDRCFGLEIKCSEKTKWEDMTLLRSAAIHPDELMNRNCGQRKKHNISPTSRGETEKIESSDGLQTREPYKLRGAPIDDRFQLIP